MKVWVLEITLEDFEQLFFVCSSKGVAKKILRNWVAEYWNQSLGTECPEKITDNTIEKYFRKGFESYKIRQQQVIEVA